MVRHHVAILRLGEAKGYIGFAAFQTDRTHIGGDVDIEAGMRRG